jgi:hypothetical protein
MYVCVHYIFIDHYPQHTPSSPTTQNYAPKTTATIIPPPTHTNLHHTLLHQNINKTETIILENVGEELDATLDPVLARAVYKKGVCACMCVCVGGGWW